MIDIGVKILPNDDGPINRAGQSFRFTIYLRFADKAVQGRDEIEELSTIGQLPLRLKKVQCAFQHIVNFSVSDRISRWC
ncbi:hypothetical protein D3C78_1695770 [compost metagenome]